MRRAAMILAALAIVGLATTAASAATVVAYATPGLYPMVTPVGPVMVHPPVYHYPSVVYPVPRPAVYVRPPVRRAYRYHYYSRPSVSYYGSGIGISIGF